nr:cop9 signalosome complex subunit 7a [Quercus suber]
MDQSRALNALAPFLALAKSATSPRAAADLVSQATSAPNTTVFAELLQQPNIHALASNEEYGSAHQLLQIFAWGTWDDYKASTDLPQLSDAQSRKLRLLSLLTLASQKGNVSSSGSNLSYSTLCDKLDFTSSAELESLITEAIYNDLLVGTLDPASQSVVVTSVAPRRDLAPGSVQDMMIELVAWSGRCDSVLAALESEIAKVKDEAKQRHALEARIEKQVKAVTDASEKSGNAGAAMQTSRGGGHMVRGGPRAGNDEDDDAMELDGGGAGLGSGGGKKRGSNSGPMSSFMGKFEALLHNGHTEHKEPTTSDALQNGRVIRRNLQLTTSRRISKMDRLQSLEEEGKKHGLGPSWVGSWPLGNGSYGKVCLFLKQDRNSKIVDVREGQEPDGLLLTTLSGSRSKRPDPGRTN